MGRIKTKFAKRKTRELIKKYGEHFVTDFAQNKLQVTKHAVIQSKKIRNIIAGYVTRLKKHEQ